MIQLKYTENFADILSFDELLRGWHSLSGPLQQVTDIAWCLRLLKYEIENANRPFIVDRICSRITGIGETIIREQLHDFCTEIAKTRVAGKGY